MSDKISMSLDEIIKSNKASSRGRARGGNHGGTQRGGKFVQRGRGRGGIIKNTSSTVGAGSTTLMISNLEFGVTDTDISMLFAEFGPLRKAVIHYDGFGKPQGTAHVTFERRSDAAKAMKQYNGVLLDGRIMHILLAVTEVPNAVRGDRNEMPKKNSRGRGQPSNLKRKLPTTEELDSELEAYNRLRMKTE